MRDMSGQLKELAEIVRGERPNPQELYDHDLRVHKLSLQACNIPLAEEKKPIAELQPKTEDAR